MILLYRHHGRFFPNLQWNTNIIVRKGTPVYHFKSNALIQFGAALAPATLARVPGGLLATLPDAAVEDDLHGVVAVERALE